MNGPELLRDITNRLLEAILVAVGQESRGAPISQSQLGSIFDRFMTSPEYVPFFDDAYQDLVAAVPGARVDCRRTDPFGRLMVQPLIGLFEGDAFEREILPNLFSFFHLVLGDDEGHFSDECRGIVDQIKAETSDKFTWDLYYRDDRAQRVFWRVLVRIASLFKRWDLRKEWFLKLMQYTPSTSSVGPMAFQIHAPGAHDASAPMVFGEDEFKRLFHALFDPIARLTPLQLAAFRKEFGGESVVQIEAVLNRL